MYDLTICIPTYRRPELLDRCLGELERQLPLLCFKCQVIISDNNNGSLYEKIWNKYADFFEKWNVIIINTPVTLEAHENWYNALKLIRSENFIIMSDDDYFRDLSLLNNLKFIDKTVFFNSQIIKNTGSRLKRNFKQCFEASPHFFALLICTGIVKPTLCSTIMRTECLKKFLKYKLKFGRNGDHLDGFLILSSLQASKLAVFDTAALSYYSLEGYGYTTNRNLYDHLFNTKFRFLKHTVNHLKVNYALMAVLWTLLGALKVIIDKLRYRFVN